MKARSQLAAIDNNENVGRMQAVVERGANAGEARYKKCYSKKQKQWVLKPILEKKAYHFLPEISEKVLEKCESRIDYSFSGPVEYNVKHHFSFQVCRSNLG